MGEETFTLTIGHIVFDRGECVKFAARKLKWEVQWGENGNKIVSIENDFVQLGYDYPCVNYVDWDRVVSIVTSQEIPNMTQKKIDEYNEKRKLIPNLG